MTPDATPDAIFVRIDVVDRIALICMTQPSNRNALSTAMREALQDAIRTVNDSDDFDGMVLTGDALAFCAGGDLSTMGRMTPAQAEARILAAHALPRCIHDSPKPVVAAVEGICAGAGLALAAVCDLVVAGTAAQFMTSYEKVGLMPDLGATWSVTARIGSHAARRLFLLGGTLSAQEAQDAGFSDFLVAAGGAETMATDLATRLARTAPGTRHAVRKVFRAPPATLEDALRFEAVHQPALYLSADLHEGIAAFREKRDPVWRDA